MRWMIDGNNFLHFDAALSKRMRESGISSAMKLLCDDLAKAVSQGHHFHLVFDSGSSSVGGSVAKPGLEILFAESGKTGFPECHPVLPDRDSRPYEHVR